MANSKGVGSPLDKDVAKQLQVRSEIISKQYRDGNTLLFLNANKPWIRLSSGVNTLSDDEIEALEKSNRTELQAGSSALAKKHTLGLLNRVIGGVSKDEYTPISRSQKGAITEKLNSFESENATYRNYPSLGYRPVPGITSATVRSKGSYGVLRETTVEFVVWTLEDLDLVEALYLRPGYTMLLEWGHSLYFDNKKEFQTVSFQFGDDFFSPKSDSDIETKIEEFRSKSGYNYDAVFGYVKNFSWNFRKDGGYNCTITIASKGTLIESLRVDRSPADYIPAKDLSRGSVKDYREQQKSVFHYFLSRIDERYAQGVEYSKAALLQSMPTFLTPLQDFNLYLYVLNVTFWPWNRNKQIRFIPLSLILDIINNYLGKTKNGVQKITFYTGQDTDINQNYKTECKYVTSDYHFALDPTICLLAKDVKSDLTVTTYTTSGTSGITREVSSPVNIPTLRKIAGESFKHIKGQDDDILNIYITDVMLKPIVDSFVDAEQSTDRGILAFVEAILSKINDNLGGVNELSINEEKGVYYIVDRKLTAQKGTEYLELNLTGLKSTVTDLQISSKLSNQVGSQIAIAAQGIDSNYNENISELLTWNLGLVDRTLRPPQPEDSTEATDRAKKEELEKRNTWAKDLKELYDLFFDNDYDDVTFDELKTYHRDYTAKYVLSYQTVLEEPEKGVIPIELSFSLLGIAGMTVAKAFKIAEGVLPTKYSKKFGFIITGLEHEIGTQWLTKVKTQFYVVEPPNSARVDAAKAQFGPASAAGAATDTNVPEFSGETPQADIIRTALPVLGYYEKKRELSSGGDVTFEMAKATVAVLREIKTRLPNLTLTLTAGNDLYHQQYSARSRHAPGRGVDFVISDPSAENIAAVENILLAFTAGNEPYFRYLNEYAVSTTYATGKHFHISWGTGSEGNSNVQKAREAVAAGRITPIKI